MHRYVVETYLDGSGTTIIQQRVRRINERERETIALMDIGGKLHSVDVNEFDSVDEILAATSERSTSFPLLRPEVKRMLTRRFDDATA